MSEHDGAAATVLFSAAEDYFSAASEELGSGPAQVQVRRLGPDLGSLSGAGTRLDRIAARCRNEPLVFVKHLTTELTRLPVGEATDLDTALHAVLTALPAGTPEALAVQAWVSGTNPLPYGSAELAKQVEAALSAGGTRVARAGLARTLSLCLTRTGLLVGLADTADQLADWPGGRSRFAKRAEQVSRAEFKLEEAIQAFGLTPRPGQRALDLGASPGGWTRILRQHGVTVCAVDPGDLHERLRDDDGVRHQRTTAGEFLRARGERFDLLVNDMKMDPERSCRIVLDAATRLHAGAVAVLTLKLGAHRPLPVVRRCLRLLGDRYRVLAARQLHHNRHEVTVVAERRQDR